MTELAISVERLREQAEAIEQEAGLAIMFHETWKPSAYDTDLHQRMGNSFATQSFNIVRLALRRELLMALARLWDQDNRSLSIPAIGASLRKPDVFDALCSRRVARSRATTVSLTPEIDLSGYYADAMKRAIALAREQLEALIQKYERGGSHYEVIKRLMMLRSVSLAHRQKRPKPAEKADAADDEIETFYQDNLEIVRLTLKVVLGKAFDLTEAADIYQTYASFFWAGAQGENTEGHPRFRRPPL